MVIYGNKMECLQHGRQRCVVMNYIYSVRFTEVTFWINCTAVPLDASYICTVNAIVT